MGDGDPYDFWSTRRTLDAIGDRHSFGLNVDPSHLYWMLLDPLEFVYAGDAQIYYMHVKEAVRNLNGRNGALGSHLFVGAYHPGWDFVSPGRGGVPFEHIFRALNDVGYISPSRSSGRQWHAAPAGCLRGPGTGTRARPYSLDTGF